MIDDVKSRSQEEIGVGGPGLGRLALQTTNPSKKTPMNEADCSRPRRRDGATLAVAESVARLRENLAMIPRDNRVGFPGAGVSSHIAKSGGCKRSCPGGSSRIGLPGPTNPRKILT